MIAPKVRKRGNHTIEKDLALTRRRIKITKINKKNIIKIEAENEIIALTMIEIKGAHLTEITKAEKEKLHIQSGTHQYIQRQVRERTRS